MLNEEIYIGDFHLKKDGSAFIIAEAGSNHNQSLKMALQLIDAAAKAGANAIKFQLFLAEKLYPQGHEYYDIFKSIELNRKWVPDLVKHAENCGICFLASVFDNESVDILNEIGVKAIKIASSEAVNLPLLSYAAQKGRPMIVSTGMCDLADVYEAVEVIQSEGNQNIVLLQCTALYPAPHGSVNLRVMDTLRSVFHVPVGFSDHTLDIFTSIAAVARGARVIEKHLTLDRSLSGPDHFYALEPNDMKQMIQAIRAVEESLGSRVKKMLNEEAPFARRDSIKAGRDISVNEIITDDMIVLQRPGLGIRARFIKAVIGRKINGNVKKGEPITWENIKVL